MSLICDETGCNISGPIRVGTREDVNFFSALSKEVLNLIPAEERRSEPCRPGDAGVDIHAAEGSANAAAAVGGEWSAFGMQLGGFLYSVSKETAEKYLPKHLRRYEKAHS